MINLKVLSTAAAMALVLPVLAPTASFGQNPNTGRGAPAGAVRGGGGGGAPAARFGGGGGAPQAFRGGSPQQGFNGGGVRSGGGGGAPVAQYGGGGGWRGGGGWHDGRRRDRDGGFIPGAVAGAVIGGALASQSYGYYGGPGYYYSPGYYDDQYYDDSVVTAAPAPVGDDVAYCMQTYQSYDPASGTYLGYDGLRHPCP